MIGHPEFDYLTHLEGLRGKDAKQSGLKTGSKSETVSEKSSESDRPHSDRPR